MMSGECPSTKTRSQQVNLLLPQDLCRTPVVAANTNTEQIALTASRWKVGWFNPDHHIIPRNLQGGPVTSCTPIFLTPQFSPLFRQFFALNFPQIIIAESYLYASIALPHPIIFIQILSFL
jgi:hypothetical protein